MSPLDRIRGTGVRRGTALAATGLMLTAGLSVVATSAANAKPVYPSADQVEQAKQAAGSAAVTVHGLEASLAVASAKLEALQTQVQVAAEAYDVARIELDQRAAAAKAARAQADAAQAAADQAQTEVGQLAVDSYYDGRTFGGLEVLVGASTPQELLQSAASYRIANNVVSQTYERARASRVVATVMRRQADAALAQQTAAAARLELARKAVEAKAATAKQQTAAISAQRTVMIAQLAKLQKISVSLATQRQEGLEAERRARAEAARRAAAQRAERAAEKRRQAAERRKQRDSSSGGSSDNGSSSGNPGGGSSGGSSQGTSSGGAAAASWALTQLGKPYEWAADGPSTYDCSGLTLQAWARAGVYLPHSSGMQYAMTEHVSYGSMRRGDLVFFATDPSNPGTIHHVGIYIGGGQMVEAPYTGANVRISSIWRSDRMPYAGRP